MMDVKIQINCPQCGTAAVVAHNHDSGNDAGKPEVRCDNCPPKLLTKQQINVLSAKVNRIANTLSRWVEN